MRQNDSSEPFPMTIGKLAQCTHCTIDMIRYYEEIGLLPAPARSAGRHRLYQKQHFHRLIFTRQCRALDFSLDEIRDLLQLVDEGAECARVRRILEQHLDDVRSGIVHLLKVESILQNLALQCALNLTTCCPAIDRLGQSEQDDLQPFRLSVSANLSTDRHRR